MDTLITDGTTTRPVDPKLRFDGTISFGNILTLIVLIVGCISAYIQLSTTNATQDLRLAAIEKNIQTLADSQKQLVEVQRVQELNTQKLQTLTEFLLPKKP